MSDWQPTSEAVNKEAGRLWRERVAQPRLHWHEVGNPDRARLLRVARHVLRERHEFAVRAYMDAIEEEAPGLYTEPGVREEAELRVTELETTDGS